MARTKPIPTAELPEEKQPAFLQALAGLPGRGFTEGLEQLAAEARERFNDAIRAAVPAQVDSALVQYRAVIYRLNGDTWKGCRAEQGAECRLERLLAARPGHVPGWGQAGEWLLEVEGVRIRVAISPYGLGVHSLGLHAVDADAPFLSDTGYLSYRLDPRHWCGHELAGAVLSEVSRLVSGDCKPTPIIEGYRQNGITIPAWLAPVLEGVTRNGQQALPLSGRATVELPAPIAAEPTAPMSNADRQREFRRRQKQKREQAKAEGVRTLELSDVDLARIWIALDTHLAFNKLLDWDLEGHLQTAGRLFADQPAAYLDQLGTSKGVINQQKQRDKDARRGWDAYKEECLRTKSQVNRINELQHENSQLKAGLQEIAAELGAVPAPVVKPGADVEVLQAELARLRKECEMLEAERCKAFAATRVFEDRLRQAGLSTDYRPHLVE